MDIRDRALLLAAFASGGRRRSEIAGLRVEDLVDEEPVHAILIGRSVGVLKQWLAVVGIETGPVFRGIDQWGNIDRRALTP